MKGRRKQKRDIGVPRGSQALKEKWNDAIEALLTNATVSQAAKAIGEKGCTVQLWLNTYPMFANAVDEARRLRLAQGRLYLQGMSPRLVEEAIKIALDENAHPVAKLQAIKLILDINGKMEEKELAALEARQKLEGMRRLQLELRAQIEEIPVTAMRRGTALPEECPPIPRIETDTSDIEETDWVEVRSTEDSIENSYLPKADEEAGFVPSMPGGNRLD